MWSCNLDSPDELGRLGASFNRMTEEYRQNLERSVQRQRELNETQLRMLQAQLNPHFLYNTLDCMKWLGITQPRPPDGRLCPRIWRRCCGPVSPAGELIPLEDELELVGQYLNIQEIRFEDRFACVRSMWTSGSSTASCPRWCCSPWWKTPSSTAWPIWRRATSSSGPAEGATCCCG
ncbi:MAG: histidine kinase [Oscillospiraceae bacterium]